MKNTLILSLFLLSSLLNAAIGDSRIFIPVRIFVEAGSATLTQPALFEFGPEDQIKDLKKEVAEIVLKLGQRGKIWGEILPPNKVTFLKREEELVYDNFTPLKDTEFVEQPGKRAAGTYYVRVRVHPYELPEQLQVGAFERLYAKLAEALKNQNADALAILNKIEKYAGEGAFTPREFQQAKKLYDETLKKQKSFLDFSSIESTISVVKNYPTHQNESALRKAIFLLKQVKLNAQQTLEVNGANLFLVLITRIRNYLISDDEKEFAKAEETKDLMLKLDISRELKETVYQKYNEAQHFAGDYQELKKALEKNTDAQRLILQGNPLADNIIAKIAQDYPLSLLHIARQLYAKYFPAKAQVLETAFIETVIKDAVLKNNEASAESYVDELQSDETVSEATRSVALKLMGEYKALYAKLTDMKEKVRANKSSAAKQALKDIEKEFPQHSILAKKSFFDVLFDTMKEKLAQRDTSSWPLLQYRISELNNPVYDARARNEVGRQETYTFQVILLRNKKNDEKFIVWPFYTTFKKRIKLGYGTTYNDVKEKIINFFPPSADGYEGWSPKIDDIFLENDERTEIDPLAHDPSQIFKADGKSFVAYIYIPPAISLDQEPFPTRIPNALEIAQKKLTHYQSKLTEKLQALDLNAAQKIQRGILTGTFGPLFIAESRTEENEKAKSARSWISGLPKEMDEYLRKNIDYFLDKKDFATAAAYLKYYQSDYFDADGFFHYSYRRDAYDAYSAVFPLSVDIRGEKSRQEIFELVFKNVDNEEIFKDVVQLQVPWGETYADIRAKILNHYVNVDETTPIFGEKIKNDFAAVIDNHILKEGGLHERIIKLPATLTVQVPSEYLTEAGPRLIYIKSAMAALKNKIDEGLPVDLAASKVEIESRFVYSQSERDYLHQQLYFLEQLIKAYAQQQHDLGGMTLDQQKELQRAKEIAMNIRLTERALSAKEYTIFYQRYFPNLNPFQKLRVDRALQEKRSSLLKDYQQRIEAALQPYFNTSDATDAADELVAQFMTLGWPEQENAAIKKTYDEFKAKRAFSQQQTEIQIALMAYRFDEAKKLFDQLPYNIYTAQLKESAKKRYQEELNEMRGTFVRNRLRFLAKFDPAKKREILDEIREKSVVYPADEQAEILTLVSSITKLIGMLEQYDKASREEKPAIKMSVRNFVRDLNIDQSLSKKYFDLFRRHYRELVDSSNVGL